MQRITFWLPILLLILLSCSESSQETQRSAEEELSLSLGESDAESSAKKVANLTLSEMESAQSQYLVPSPGEVLSSLDKLDRVPWSQLASYETKADYDDKYTRSFNLGVRVADAFMAVKAEDAAKFGEMSTIIFDLAREIGLGEVLENRRGSLDNLAAEGKWKELEAALDNVQTDVRREVEAMGEDELVAMASVGGWIEGMAAVTAHLEENYATDHAQLLQQSELLGYFLQKFEAMEDPARAHPLVQQTKQTLSELLPLIEGEQVPTLDKTRQIYILTSGLVQEIEH